MQEDLFYLLALQKVKGIGDISAKKLLKHFGTAQKVFEAAHADSIDIPDIGDFIIGQLKNFDDFALVEKELKYIEKENIKTVSIFDENYPHHLFHAPDGPILFFTKGNIKLNNRKILSIVGTRNITPYGKRMIEEIIEELSPYQPVIISGLAYGVDIHSHIEALKKELDTIAVLGHGFQRIYPAMHKKIADQMLSQGGLITEFWHTDSIDRNNFLKRNRIIAGISQATLIVESGEKGGSLVTADIANSYNRDVFAIPGRASDIFSKGCNNLIKNNQAQLVTSGKDIIDYLQWESKEKTNHGKQLNLFVDLSPEEQQIFDFLNENGKTGLDEIAFSLSFPISKTAQLLLQMELNNVVAGLAGKQFEII